MNALVTLSPPLILASESPRRRSLLEQMGLSFSAQVSPADETLEEPLPPEETVRRLASRKATPVAETHSSALVLAADTVVVHREEILEKPETPRAAQEMLRRLSASTHEVFTGMALYHEDSNRQITTCTESRVRFGALSDDEISAYVETGSPMDKAGGYGIQDHTGPLFIDHLEGDYYNVVGLPLRRLYVTLRDEFEDLLVASSFAGS